MLDIIQKINSQFVADCTYFPDDNCRSLLLEFVADCNIDSSTYVKCEFIPAGRLVCEWGECTYCWRPADDMVKWMYNNHVHISKAYPNLYLSDDGIEYASRIMLAYFWTSEDVFAPVKEIAERADDILSKVDLSEQIYEAARIAVEESGHEATDVLVERVVRDMCL